MIEVWILKSREITSPNKRRSKSISSGSQKTSSTAKRKFENRAIQNKGTVNPSNLSPPETLKQVENSDEIKLHKELERKIAESNDEFEVTLRLHHENNAYSDLPVETLEQLLKDRKEKYLLRENQLFGINGQVQELNQKLIQAYEEREEIYGERDLVAKELEDAEYRFKMQMEK